MDWQQRITKAKDTGRFTVGDFDLAQSFQTCAVGEICDEVFGFYTMPAPDTKVDDLGMLFNRLVRSNDIEGAQLVYNEIQQLGRADF